MQLDNQFRDIVQQQMKLKGWSQNELARQMGVASSYVSQYLSGRCSPGDDVKDRFFDALDLEPILTVRRKNVVASA